MLWRLLEPNLGHLDSAGFEGVSLLVFLSYSHKDKNLARHLKDVLASFGFDVFLAHEDISPSFRWEKTILRKLRQCDIFVPILTKEFAKSDWTDQEAGFALSRKKLIIPLQVDLKPYGFCAAYEALALNKRVLYKTCWRIIKILAQHRRYERTVQDGAVQALVNSRSFDEAEEHLKGVLELGTLPAQQLNTLLRGCLNNQNIYGSIRARPLMEKLLAKGRRRFSSHILSRYRAQVKAWTQ